MESKEEEETIIRHTLFEEDEGQQQGELPFEGYVETSELIKNMDVTYEEIDIHHLAEFEQVMINEIDVTDFVIVEPAKREESSEAFVEVNRDVGD